MDGTRSLVSGGELFLYGVIDPYAMDGEGVRAIDVIASLNGLKGDSITVRINSPGGSVTEGIAIFNALRADRRPVTVKVDAMAASIASVIAMAGDEIVMAENASMMIHDPWAMAVGSSNDMRAMADEIDRLKGIIVAIYAARTGLTTAELENLMSAETYMSASDAVERGFAHRVDIPLKIAACASLGRDELARLIFGNSIRPVTNEPAPAAPAAPTERDVPMQDVMNEAGANTAIDEAKVRAEAAKAERDRVAKIVAFGRRAGVDSAVVDALVADGSPVETAQAKILDAWSAARAETAGPEVRPEVRIVRDERETKIKAMGEALVNRLGVGGKPSDMARDYMGHSIVDMASELMGSRTLARTAAAREAVIRNAMHSTSDFPILLEDALNKALEARYALASPTYRTLARQRSYADFRAHTSIRMGDFPMLAEVGEGGELEGGTLSENKESTMAKAYGVQFAITRQLMVNDNLGGIQQVLASYGDTVARFEESTFYAMMLTASGAGPTLNETSRAVFNTTDVTKASANAAVTAAAVAIGRAAMRKKTSLDGAKLNITPSILLVGPDKEYEAQQLVAPVNAAQTSNVNPFSGALQVVVTPYITGNSWYLLAAPGSVPCFEWGLLDGYTAPRLRIDEPFGVQGTKVSLEHDFGCGAIDFRGGFWNAGA